MAKAQTNGRKKGSHTLDGVSSPISLDHVLTPGKVDDQGLSTLETAGNYLRNLRKSLQKLSVDEGQASVLETQAGTRTLWWLRNHGLHESTELAGDSRLLQNIVWFLEREKRDE